MRHANASHMAKMPMGKPEQATGEPQGGMEGADPERPADDDRAPCGRLAHDHARQRQAGSSRHGGRVGRAPEQALPEEEAEIRSATMRTTPTKSDRIRDSLILHEIETYLCATAFGKVATQGALKAAAKKIFRSGSLPKPVAAEIGVGRCRIVVWRKSVTSTRIAAS